MTTDPQTPTTCRTCVTPINLIESPTASWWAHETHPTDDHDAVPAAWVDGDPLMEAIAGTVWEHCNTEGTSLIVDDPRNIAATAAAVARAQTPAVPAVAPTATDGAAEVFTAADLVTALKGAGTERDKIEAKRYQQERATALREAAQHLYTALFPAVYNDLGQKAAEGVNRAVSELRRLAEPEMQTEARQALIAELLPVWEAMYEPGNVSDYLIGYTNHQDAATGAAEAWMRSQAEVTGRLEWVPQTPLDGYDMEFELVERHDDGVDTGPGITVRRRVDTAAVPAVGQTDEEASSPRTVCVCGHTKGEHIRIGGSFGQGRLLCDVCDPESTENLACKEFEAL